MNYDEPLTFYDEDRYRFQPDTWRVVGRVQDAARSLIGLNRLDNGELHAFLVAWSCRSQARSITRRVCRARSEDELRLKLRHEARFFEETRAAVPPRSKLLYGSVLGWERREWPQVRGLVIFQADTPHDEPVRPRAYEVSSCFDAPSELSAFEAEAIEPARAALFVDSDREVSRLMFYKHFSVS